MCFGNTVAGPSQYNLQSSSSTQKTKYDPWVTQAGQNIIGQMQGAVSANPAQSYSGPATASFGDQWGTATNYLTNALSQGGTPQMTGASNMLTNFLGGLNPNAPVSEYMSPYVDATLAPTIRNIQQNANLQGAENAHAATMAGQYGGTGMGVRQALLDNNTNQQISDATSQAYANAWNQAQAARNAMQGTYLTGTGQLGGLGAQLGSYLSGLAGGLGNMGSAEQKAGQTGIGEQLSINKQNALLPVQQLSPLSAALAAIPKNSTTNTNSVGNSTGSSTQTDNSGYQAIGSILGGLLAGL